MSIWGCFAPANANNVRTSAALKSSSKKTSIMNEYLKEGVAALKVSKFELSNTRNNRLHEKEDETELKTELYMGQQHVYM